MKNRLAVIGALSAGLLIAGSPVAMAQTDPVMAALPGSVSGSLPGGATGPIGSATTTVCNVGSVANRVGSAVPTDPFCQFLPSLGAAADHFFQADYDGVIRSLVGAVPYVGSVLNKVVPTDSGAAAMRDGLGAAGIDPTTLMPPMPEIPMPELPGS